MNRQKRPLNIVLALDSFKESMSSLEAADAFEKGFHRILPATRFTKLALSDGGEGFAASFVRNKKGYIKSVKARDPLGRPVRASLGFFNGGRSAVIETACASGLMRLSSVERNPLKTTTYGTGQLIDAALKSGAREIIIGPGGSATHDCGVGLAQALGVCFLDKRGRLLPAPITGKDLLKVGAIQLGDLPHRLKSVRIRAACDVDNVMTGKRGAAYVYAPQKGASPEIVRRLDAGVRHLCRVIKRDLKRHIEHIPGSGAAGGLGGGLMAFLGAKPESGINLMLETVGFEVLVRRADLVVTGEGQIDLQTINNKAPVGIARVAKRYGVPVLAICGRRGRGADLTYAEGITSIHCIVSGPCDLDEALKKGKENMEHMGENLARFIRSIKK